MRLGEYFHVFPTRKSISFSALFNKPFTIRAEITYIFNFESQREAFTTHQRTVAEQTIYQIHTKNSMNRHMYSYKKNRYTTTILIHGL